MYMKCPACGARIIDSMALKCPDCGYVFTNETTSSKDIRDSIDQFHNRLIAASSAEEKAEIIRSFSLPNTIEGLMSLLSLSSSNFNSSNGNEDRMISAAWLGKARQAYYLLKDRCGSDKEILSLLKQYSFLEEKDSVLTIKESYKQKKRKKTIRWVVIGLIIIVVIYLFLLVLSNMDVDETSEKTLRQEVMELIQEKEFDKARIKASEAEYSWDQRELLQMIEEAETKSIN